MSLPYPCGPCCPDAMLAPFLLFALSLSHLGMAQSRVRALGVAGVPVCHPCLLQQPHAQVTPAGGGRLWEPRPFPTLALLRSGPGVPHACPALCTLDCKSPDVLAVWVRSEGILRCPGPSPLTRILGVGSQSYLPPHGICR